MDCTFDRLDSALGPILLVCHEDRLVSLDYGGYESRMLRLLAARFGRVALKEGAAPRAVRAAVCGYLDGDCSAPDALALEAGGTAFQRKVWGALRQIPAGTTTSYGALAARLGQPGAARALGRADALNPIAIVVPCHRVIGADGSLGGYAGGIARKRWLLAHEGVAI